MTRNTEQIALRLTVKKLTKAVLLEDGFEYEGLQYRSLSAVAKAITGSHLNGYAFFGFGSRRPKRAVKNPKGS